MDGILPRLPGKYLPLALAGLWIVVQLTMLSLFGIGHGGDTERYLSSGRQIAAGEWPSGKAASYLAYDLVVGVSLALGLGEPGVVALQLAASAVAAYGMFRLGARLWSRPAGYVAAGLYIIFLKLHPWNVFILTDSLFISFGIITAWLFLAATTAPRHKLWLGIATALAATFTTFLRPDGLSIPLSFIAVAVAMLVRQRQWARVSLVTVVIVALIAAAWNFAGRLASHEFLVEHYAEGAVIWSYEPYYLTMPEALPETIEPGGNTLTNLAYFALDKPLYLLRLAGAKLLLELVHVRPYHATVHNLLIASSLAVLYGGVLVSLRQRLVRYSPAIVFLSAFFGWKMLIVAGTFADWSGRFLLHVLPVVILFASPALARFITVTPPQPTATSP